MQTDSGKQFTLSNMKMVTLRSENELQEVITSTRYSLNATHEEMDIKN